jgi:ribosome-associated protein
LEEIVAQLQEDNGREIRTMDMTGRSDIAQQMVFVTGASAPHMRKMGDALVKAQKKRKLWDIEPGVEGRDCDDWMVVDCGPVIVHIFDAVGRAYYDLETHWAAARQDGPHELYAGLDLDELCEKFPCPDEDALRREIEGSGSWDESPEAVDWIFEGGVASEEGDTGEDEAAEDDAAEDDAAEDDAAAVDDASPEAVIHTPGIVVDEPSRARSKDSTPTGRHPFARRRKKRA